MIKLSKFQAVLLTMALAMCLVPGRANAQTEVLGLDIPEDVINSAVASVKADDFLTGNIGDAAQLIKGKVAGLDIAKGTGNPSESSTIMLRGVTSLMGGFTPLILIDGVEGSLNTVSPENIAEISVLKDASAAAIYGTRGASGVILITTKSGKRGERYNVSYSGYGAISDFAKTADFMDAAYMRSLGEEMSE